MWCRGKTCVPALFFINNSRANTGIRPYKKMYDTGRSVI
ncbi:hypothetical protein H206_06160 [Candidatus Electrothrix aarhusensis]|uniref:Uncharacterized protein n=1 Tax=Candidatus Electrothrix aarhusensis TaxID=1859131 RepID=A0A3S3RTI1_9BACT|nr:hypothetical protein H206_06160 [Candidatus Electrothrix aarhusensis]